MLDLIGQTFGRLKVIKKLPERKGARGEIQWHCICSCGNTKNIVTSNLRSGNTQSCGCLQKEKLIKMNTKHGLSNNYTYSTWNAMIQRCYPSDKSQVNPNYAGKGITVCDRWRYSFQNFLADMGERPEGLSIDRRENDKGYYPENCRWATDREQILNRDCVVEYSGQQIEEVYVIKRVYESNVNLNGRGGRFQVRCVCGDEYIISSASLKRKLARDENTKCKCAYRGDRRRNA